MDKIVYYTASAIDLEWERKGAVRSTNAWIQRDTLNLRDQRRKIKMKQSMHSSNYEELSKEIKHPVKS